MTTTRYSIPEHRMDAFYKAMEKINNAALRLGVTPAGYEVIGHEVERRTIELPAFEGKPLVRLINRTIVDVTGATPKFEGWRLAAVIETGDPLNVVSCVPGESVNPAYRTAKLGCDHCNTRRFRKEHFVVKNVDGTEKIVGRSCLAAFLGIESLNPHALYALVSDQSLLIQFADDADENIGGAGRAPEIFGVGQWLALTAAAVRVEGMFVTRTKAEESMGQLTSTVDTVMWGLFAKPGTAEARDRQNKLRPTAEDRKAAAAALRLVRSKYRGVRVESASDFEFGILTVLKNRQVTLRQRGTAAYIYQLGRRLAGEQAAKADKNNAFVGRVGERLRGLQLRVVAIHEVDTQYGVLCIVRMEDEAGHTYVWKTTSGAPAERGESVTLDGSVKEHSEYRGVRQTVLTRCKVIA